MNRVSLFRRQAREATRGSRRGQVTMEYLLVTVVALAMVGISLTALGDIRRQADEAQAYTRFTQDVQRLRDTTEQLCLLGDGNARSITVKELEVTSVGENIRVRYGSWEHQETTLCPMQSAMLEGEIILENKKGIIKIKN